MTQERSSSRTLAIGLGWFSLGLGLAELLTPGAVARLAGIRPTRSSKRTLQAMGLREIGTGAAILARPGTPTPLWARVAGDAMDLSLLGKAFGDPGAHRRRLG